MSDEHRTELAQKRTELAYERTVLAYFRTGASLMLFGVAFLGFNEQFDLIFFLYGGYIAILAGVILFLLAITQERRHGRDIAKLTTKEFKRIAGKFIPGEREEERDGEE